MRDAIVARKVADLRARVARVRELLPDSLDEFMTRRTEAEALILNLYLALQGMSDLALALVAHRGLGVPGTPREALTLLRNAGDVDHGLAERLSAAIGLRNRIAHQYGSLDLRLVYEAANTELSDLDAFGQAALRS